MAYITIARCSSFEKCRATINEETGKASVWVDLDTGHMAFYANEVDGLINALSAALTMARELEDAARSDRVAQK